MAEPTSNSFISALDDFDRLHWRATWESLWNGLRGRSNELLSYEDVSRQLKITGRADSGVQDIPLDAIVGSVGRYNDFTRSFLPKQPSGRERWARVRASADADAGWPPIEVYKVGEAYFVLDGNHRVSAARDMGQPTIQANVTEIRTRVPFSPNDTPDDIIAKAEYAQFLEETRLDELIPGADLRLTVANGYPQLLEHIIVHRYYMGIEQEREIPFDEAVQHWYETVYLPVVDMIRSSDLLRLFPNRTEADLYLWIGRNQAELTLELGMDVSPANVVAGMAASEGDLARTPAQPVHAATIRRDTKPFDILLPMSGEEVGWTAFDQALIVAEREPVRLHGLHVVPVGDAAALEQGQALQAEFEQRCQAAGLEGRMVVTAGDLTRELKRRARWTDLLLVNLAHTPGEAILDKVRPSFQSLVRQVVWPMLVTPSHASPLTHPILAFDGSRNSMQALYLLTFLAGRWQLPLSVVTVVEGTRVTAEIQHFAREYLSQHCFDVSKINFITEEGPVGPAILRAVELYECDWIVMGGFSRRGLGDMMIDSALDGVLRRSWWPILVCR